jgi:hypothetical protein
MSLNFPPIRRKKGILNHKIPNRFFPGNLQPKIGKKKEKKEEGRGREKERE